MILIELLASSLNGICDAESFGLASILLESWLNIREADYQTSDRMTKALQDSPLAGISQQTLWANTITTFSLSLSLWRLRGRRHAYQLLEAWLRNWLEISIDCFDTPGDLSNRVIGQLKAKLGDNTFTGSVVTHLSDFWIGEANFRIRGGWLGRGNGFLGSIRAIPAFSFGHLGTRRETNGHTGSRNKPCRRQTFAT